MKDFPPFQDEGQYVASIRDAQKRSAIKIKVVMPVTIGGYTGQRDAWEETTDDYEVTGDRNNVVLSRTGGFGRKITLSLNNIEAALAALGNVHPGGPDRIGG